MNKTGTTSLLYEFDRLGVPTGKQREGEKLLPKVINGNFESIKHYCKTARFFQDIPFSIPNVYKYLDLQFPNSKFILSVRSSSEEWYESLIRFHTKTDKIGLRDKLPNSYDLKQSKYVYKGWVYDAHNFIYNTPYDDPYNKDILIQTYENHKTDVLDYFSDRSGDLIVVDLSKDESYTDFKNFFGIRNKFNTFLHKNSSK